MKGVYIFGCNGMFKIGVSANIKSRAKTLQTGNPFKINKIAYLDIDNYYEIELKIHEEHSEKRTNGEWFLFDENTLSSIISVYNFTLLVDIKDICFHSSSEIKVITDSIEKSYKNENTELLDSISKIKIKNTSLKYKNAELERIIQKPLLNDDLEKKIQSLEKENTELGMSLKVLLDTYKNECKMSKAYFEHSRVNFELSRTYFNLFCNESRINELSDNRYRNQIKELKEQIKELKACNLPKHTPTITKKSFLIRCKEYIYNCFFIPAS